MSKDHEQVPDESASTAQDMQAMIDLLETDLSPDLVPRWGIMTPHHLVEHLSLVFIYSTGKFGKEFKGEVERARKIKDRFMQAERPFPKSVPLPGLAPGELRPLREASLEDAKQVLRDSVQRFHQHYAAQPYDQNPHGYLGLMTYDEWQKFHLKHLEHHAIQFGLLPE